MREQRFPKGQGLLRKKGPPTYAILSRNLVLAPFTSFRNLTIANLKIRTLRKLWGILLQSPKASQPLPGCCKTITGGISTSFLPGISVRSLINVMKMMTISRLKAETRYLWVPTMKLHGFHSYCKMSDTDNEFWWIYFSNICFGENIDQMFVNKYWYWWQVLVNRFWSNICFSEMIEQLVLVNRFW